MGRGVQFNRELEQLQSERGRFQNIYWRSRKLHIIYHRQFQPLLLTSRFWLMAAGSDGNAVILSPGVHANLRTLTEMVQL